MLNSRFVALSFGLTKIKLTKSRTRINAYFREVRSV